MPNKLVIVESPAKAKTIGKFLGRGYKVEASNGHVRDLPKSQIGVDVDHNFEPKYITIRGRGEILEKIRKEAKNATHVYLATDPDREGEAISWHLMHVLGISENTPCRIEFNEITGQAVKNAIKNPRMINQRLVSAQQARRVLDRLVGYKLSPLLWAKIRKGLSAGRVQSVATRIICDREDEIRAFTPEEYWTVDALMRAGKAAFPAKLYGMRGHKAELKCQADVDAALEMIRNAQKFEVTQVKTGEKRKNPAPPFTTSNLQQEASRKLGFTTRKTMQLAQQLYEGVDIAGEGTIGLVSYIRTDSTRLSEEALNAARDYIGKHYDGDYLPQTPNVYKSRKTAQDAHEAIRPTDVYRTPDSIKESLGRDLYKLYRLIWLRFLASQMTPAVYDTLMASIAGGDVEFRFSGMHKKFAGFTAVYEEGSDEPEEQETSFPKIEAGQAVKPEDITPERHFTQPPPRYTEASLVRALEEKGIGRPSTYSPTITTILARGYIEREGRALVPTELGDVVTDMMKEHFKDIVDIEFTANMEEKLDAVEEDGSDWRSVISEFYGPFEQTLAKAEATIEKVEVEDEVSDISCEKCGAMMVYKTGRYGRFLACPNFPECRNTKPILVEIAAPCPKCGGKLYERTSRKGKKFFGCANYPECDFTSWDMPVTDKCPACGGMMVYKRDRKGGAYHLCTKDGCGTKVHLEQNEDGQGDE